MTVRLHELPELLPIDRPDGQFDRGRLPRMTTFMREREEMIHRSFAAAHSRLDVRARFWRTAELYEHTLPRQGAIRLTTPLRRAVSRLRVESEAIEESLGHLVSLYRRHAPEAARMLGKYLAREALAMVGYNVVRIHGYSVVTQTLIWSMAPVKLERLAPDNEIERPMPGRLTYSDRSQLPTASHYWQVKSFVTAMRPARKLGRRLGSKDTRPRRSVRPSLYRDQGPQIRELTDAGRSRQEIMHQLWGLNPGDKSARDIGYKRIRDALEKDRLNEKRPKN